VDVQIVTSKGEDVQEANVWPIVFSSVHPLIVQSVHRLIFPCGRASYPIVKLACFDIIEAPNTDTADVGLTQYV
jgi:hypothetical protein